MTNPFEPRVGWALERAGKQHADKEATIDLGTGERRTWQETSERCISLATGLRDRGLRRGDRVGILALNSARHLELWFAIPAAGLVMNDLNYRLAEEELAFICGDCDIRMLFVDDTFLETGLRLKDRCDVLGELVHVGPGTDAPEGTVAYESMTGTEPRDLDDVPAGGGDDLAAIFYTGGTTGLPKGAMLTHRNLTANAQHMIGTLRLSEEDRYLHAGPQFHLADGAFTFGVTWMGGTHVFIPAFDPKATIDAIERERISATIVVPTMINMMLNDPACEKADLSSMRALVYGASPMPSTLQAQAMERFGPILAQGYGMTEASPLVSYLTPEAHERGNAGEEPWRSRLDSAGNPVLGIRVEVRRDDEVTPCSPGEAGEIWVQGPNIMSGYWNRAEETGQAIVDGWYRSGDVAYADDGGYLFIVDRAKDMIISGGENIYTTEVENLVYSHPAVLEAAAFGVPDEGWGEAVHVEVVTKPGQSLTEEELIDHCRGQIAGFKLPRSVNIRESGDQLPKSGAGKILKRQLRAPYWEGRDRNV